jgi:2-oxoisovalerate dehydrogenase E1 component alpha subunit
VPQAVGAAYAYKRKKNGQVIATFFGDGGSSTGDTHVGMNFASVFEAPIIFICRNNGYAISTPVTDQYRGDGIASRGPGYGMATLRVDGNDLFAVYNATKLARKISLTQSRPVLIEAMTYRFGHHSTSDDSTAYRSAEEMQHYNEYNNPIVRFKKYIMNKNIWTEQDNEKCEKECLNIVTKGLKAAESQRLASPLEIFNDVYDERTKNLNKQMNELKNHLSMYENEYPLHKHEKY